MNGVGFRMNAGRYDIMNTSESVLRRGFKLAPCVLLLAILAVSCAGRGESKRADRLFEQGLFDKAVVMYEEAVQKNPGKEEYRQKLRTAKLHAAEAHLDNGILALEELRLFDARAEFQTALRFDPKLNAAGESLAETRSLIESIAGRIEDAKTCMDRQKWFEAMEELKPLRKYGVDFPEVETLHTRALDAAFKSLMDEGTAAYRGEEFTRALSLFSKALGLKPDDAQAGAMLEASRSQIQASERCSRGAALLKSGDFQEAIYEYESALALVRGHAKAAEGLQAAKKYGAKTLLADGTKALDERRFIDALTAFDRASGLIPDYPGLAEAGAKAKRAVADMVFARGEAHEKAGRPALAHASYSQVRLFVPDYPGLEKKLAATGERIEEASSYETRVAFSGDQTLQGEFRGNLKGRRGKSNVLVLSDSEVDAIKRLSPDFKPDGILTVNIGRVRVERSVAERVKRSERYVSDTRLVLNEEYDRLRDELDRDRRKMQSAEDDADDERSEVCRLRRARNRAKAEWKAAGDDDPNKDRLHRKYRRLRDETTRAERRLDKAIREYDSWRSKVKDGEHRLSSTPRYVKENVYSTHYYEIVTNRITASARATYGLADDLTGGHLVGNSVKVSRKEEDRVIEGFEPADIRPDPDELPSESTMRRRAEDELVKNLAESVARDLRRFPLRYLRVAETAEKAGDSAAAAEYYALYLFACRLPGLRKDMPRLAEVDAIIKSRTGYSVTNDAYDIPALKNLPPQFEEKTRPNFNFRVRPRS